MKILYLAPEMVVPGTHGGSSHVLEAVRSFVNIGHSVILVLRRSAGQNYFEKIENITYMRFPILPTCIGRNLSYFFASFFSSFFLRYDLVYERARIFAGIGCVVSSFFGKKSAYEMIEPYVELPLVLGTMKNGLIHLFIKRWHQFVCSRASRVLVTHSSFCTDIQSGKELFVTTGVDIHRFSSEGSHDDIIKRYNLLGKKVILYIGSFAWWHALEHVVAAASFFQKKYPEVIFLFVGDGEKMETVKDLILGLKLRNILLVGKVSLAEIPSYIAVSDICLCLFDRTYTPFRVFDYFYSPIKVHEYKAMGKPVVASSIGTLKELIVDHVNGVLVNENDKNSLIDGINYLLIHPRKAQAMGMKNRRDVLKNYDWDVINTRILRTIFS